MAVLIGVVAWCVIVILAGRMAAMSEIKDTERGE